MVPPLALLGAPLDMPSFHGPHRTHLEALTLARAAGHTGQAAALRWMIGLGVVCVGLWPVAGFQVAMLTFMSVMVAALSLAAHGRGPARRAPDLMRADAVTAEVERQLLEQVARTVSPSFRVGAPSPLGARTLSDARLVRTGVDFVHVSRSLTGLHAGHSPFCISHFEVGRRVQMRRHQPRHQWAHEIFARGLVMVLDIPRTEGWVVVTARLGEHADQFTAPTESNVMFHGTLEFDEQFAVEASSVEATRAALPPSVVTRLLTLRRRLPGVSLALSLIDGTMTCFIVQERNPFTLGNNPARWEAELDVTVETLRQLHTMIDVLHDAHADAATRAA